MATTHKFKIGIIGAGSVIEQYHLPVLLNIPEIDLKWIIDNDFTRAKSVTKGFGIKTKVSNSLSEVEDVDICLLTIPVGYRRELAEKIFARGWNLLCEKPFAVSSAEHHWYLNKAKEAQRVVGCGFMRRYYAGTILGKKLVAASPFGELWGIKASQGGKLRGTGREKDSYQVDVHAAGGGILIETGSHVIDQILFLTEATGFVLNDIKSEDLAQSNGQSPEAEISINSTLQVCGNRGVPLAISLSTKRDLFCGIELEFEHGFVRLGMGADASVSLLDRGQCKIASIASNDGATSVYQAFYAEWIEFIEAVTRGYSNSEHMTIHAKSSLLTTDFIDSVYRRFRVENEHAVGTDKWGVGESDCRA